MRTLNLRFAAGLFLFLAASGVGIFYLHRYQHDKIAADIRGQIDVAVQAGQTDEAIRLAYQYLQFRDNDVDVLVELAGWLESKPGGRRQQQYVIALLDRALQIAPQRADLRRRVVALNLKMYRWGECLDHLERLLSESPDDPQLLAEQATCQEAIGRHEDAAKNFEKALRIAPNRAETSLDYASLLFQHLRRPDDARKVLDDAVRLNPDDAEVRLGLARFFRESGKVAETVAATAEAVRLAPQNLAVLTAAAEIDQAVGKYSSARSYLAKARELAPQNTSLVCTLAWLLLCDGKSAEATKELQTALQQRPGDADALTLLGDILALDGRVAELAQVVEDLKSTASTDPTRKWNAEYLEARLLLCRGDYPAAAQKLTDLRSISAKRPALAKQANYLLAQCHGRLNVRDKEIESYRRVLDADPQAGYFRLEYARCLSRHGEFAAAVPEIRTALQRPDVPARAAIEAIGEFVEAARARGGVAAIKDLERALEPIRGDDAHAPAALAKVELLRRNARTADALTTIEQFVRRRPTQVDGLALQVRLIDEAFGPERAAALLTQIESRIGVPAELRIARLRLIDGRPNVPPAVYAALTEGMDRFSPEDRSRLLLAMTRASDPAVAGDARRRLREARPDHLDARRELTLANPADPSLRAEIAAVEGPDGRTSKLLAVEAALRAGDAADAGRRLTAVPGQDAIVLLLRGRVDELQGRGDAAKQSYSAALDAGLLDQCVEVLLTQIASAGSPGLLVDSPIFDRLRLDVDRSTIRNLLAAAPATARAGLADRLLRANAHVAAPHLVWFGRVLAEQGLSRSAEEVLARATLRAPLSDEAWTSRIAYHAGKQDSNKVDELVVAARKSLPPERAGLILVAAGRNSEAASLQATVSQATRERIEQHFRAGRISEARQALEELVARSDASEADRAWGRRALAVNLTIEPSQAAFQKSLALLAANPGDDEDRRALATVHAAQRSRMLPKGVTARAEARRLLGEIAQPRPEDLIMLARLARAESDGTTYQRILDQLRGFAATDYATALFLTQEALRAGDPVAERFAAQLRTIQSDRIETILALAASRALVGDAKSAVALLDAYIHSGAAGAEQASRQVRCGHAVFDWLHGLPMGAQPSVVTTLRDAGIRWYRTGVGRDPMALLQLVTLLCEADRLGDALDLVQTTTIQRSFTSEALAAAYVTALRRGVPNPNQLQAVERKLTAMLRERPQSTALQLALADLYEQTRRVPQAEAIYRSVLSREDGNLSASNNLAWTAVADPAKIPEAIARIDAAIDRHGPLDDLLDTRGRLLVAAGKADDGLRDLKEAADASPSAARFVQLAVVYRQLGRPAEAQAAMVAAQRFGLRPADVAPIDQEVVRMWTKN